MTRDEAAQELANLRDRLVWDVDNKNETRRAKSALNAGIEAIVGKQPDAETGLMPCGCGGKVAIAKYPGFLDTPDLYQVDCFECFVGTKPTMSPERARIAWNKAMGYADTM